MVALESGAHLDLANTSGVGGEAVRGAGSFDVRLNVRAFQRNFVGLDVERIRRLRGRSAATRDCRPQPRRSAIQRRSHDKPRAGDQSANHEPIEWKREMVVRIVDADHEAMLVPDHLKAAEIETGCQRNEEESEGAAQEFRFEAAAQAEDAKGRSVPRGDFRQRESQLPAASRPASKPGSVRMTTAKRKPRRSDQNGRSKR